MTNDEEQFEAASAAMARERLNDICTELMVDGMKAQFALIGKEVPLEMEMMMSAVMASPTKDVVDFLTFAFFGETEMEYAVHWKDADTYITFATKELAVEEFERELLSGADVEIVTRPALKWQSTNNLLAASDG